MIIPIVYHWSPRVNREKILTEGLKLFIGEKEYINPLTNEMELWKPPYICTSTDPEMALIYAIPAVTTEDGDIPELDLFQIHLLQTDSAMFRNDGKAHIIEVRVKNTIPPDRIRYIATREAE